MSYLTAPPLIPLDTPADLPRIRASFHALVASILGDKLGSGAVDADVARLVQNDLDDWEEDMFEQAAPNLKLNGMPYSTYLDDPALMEEFDEPLDRRIRSLAAEKELIQVQVAERRATTPAAIRGLMADLAERRRAGEVVPTPEDDDADKMEGIDEAPRLANKQALAQTFTATLDQLAQLQSVLPAQLERAEQAQAVVQELGRLPPS